MGMRTHPGAENTYRKMQAASCDFGGVLTPAWVVLLRGRRVWPGRKERDHDSLASNVVSSPPR
jgi:hypothetical protein